MSIFGGALGALGGIGPGGAMGGPSSSSGLQDSGMTNTVSTNVNGNIDSNIGQILAQLNQGVSGGLIGIQPSPVQNLLAPSVFGGGGGFGGLNVPMIAGLGALGIVALILLKRK